MVDVKEKVLPMLKCALKTKTNNHICEEPILLSCGHCICKRCLEAGVSHTSIECNTCKKMNERDLNVKQEPTMFNFILNHYIQPVFSMIRDEFRNSFKQYQDILENNDETIDLQIDFAKDQIQIRIESLKSELDNLNDDLNKRLDEMKVQFKQNFNESDLKNKTDENKFENELNELDKLLSSNQTLTEYMLYDHQNRLLKLKETINEIENEYPKISFNESKEVFGTNIIGEIVFTFGYNMKSCDELNSRIKVGKYETFSLNGKKEPFDMCRLPNGNLLVANRGLTLFDKSLNVINSFASLHGLDNILGVTTNSVNEIFFSDYSKKLILKTNLSFEKLALHGGNDELNSPCGICYYNGFIFVCEMNKRRVQKLDTNLVFRTSYQVNCSPMYIKNCKNTACVRSSGTNDLIFYDLDTFIELKRYNGGAGLIGTVYNRFYSFNSRGALCCYDENGELISEMTFSIKGVNGYDEWGALCFYNSKLFVCECGLSSLIAI